MRGKNKTEIRVEGQGNIIALRDVVQIITAPARAHSLTGEVGEALAQLSEAQLKQVYRYVAGLKREASAQVAPTIRRQGLWRRPGGQRTTAGGGTHGTV